MSLTTEGGGMIDLQECESCGRRWSAFQEIPYCQCGGGKPTIWLRKSAPSQPVVAWVKCSEQSSRSELPDSMCAVLTEDASGTQRIGYRVGAYWYQPGVIDGVANPRIYAVTHWQPLPPPSGDGGQDEP